MRRLWTIFALIWRQERAALWRGALLSVAVLAAGGALLGLSGWFITAAGAAGLAGIGIAFDVFRPSAGVRLLALGRTAARYGERILTHDATLRALAVLRVRLLQAQARQPLGQLVRLRSSMALNRLTADVDALDGILLRLVLPIGAGLVTLALAWSLLAWLVDPAIAAGVVLGLGLGGAGALWRAARITRRDAVLAERATQALRTRVIDLIRARADLVVSGRMAGQRALVDTACARAHGALRRLDRADRDTGAAVSVVVGAVAAAVLWAGGSMAAQGLIDPAAAALAFFAVLGLSEVVMPLRRAGAELGRMRDAAGRVVPALETGAGGLMAIPAQDAGMTSPAALNITNVTFRRSDVAAPVLDSVSVSVAAGETVALTGASGSGKSTLLFIVAGLERPEAGSVTLGGTALADLSEESLRARLAFLPQRSALIGGSVLDNLALARADLTEDAAWDVLDTVELADTIRDRGGLHAPLGDGGEGLSGGESRRMALARVILRQPEVLLLDEPTEGLSADQAARILSNLRRALPDAAILTASHRRAERDWADRLIALRK